MSNKNPVNCDVRRLTARIEQVGERAVKGISDAMRRYAEVIMRDAIANAPRKTGTLESAIRVEFTRKNGNGRLGVTIYVDPTVPYSDPDPNHKPTDKVVGDYANLIDRGLSPYGSGRYSAGVGTRAKGRRAGGRFLERAVNRHREALLRRARAIAKRAAEKA